MTEASIDVLIIEDSAGDARLVQETLRGISNPHYRVTWRDRLSTGLDCLTKCKVDTVLLDLGLPDSQGLDTLSAIQSAAPSVPIVVLSGADDEQFAVESVQAGAQDYLVKNCVNGQLLSRSLRYAIERKRADEALRKSEERLHLAMTAATVAIWEFDCVQKRRHIVIGSPVGSWTSRLHPEDQEHVIADFLGALDGQADSWSGEYRLLRQNEEWSYIQDRAVIARDRAGNVKQVVGAMVDVTGLKRAEEALQESNHKLQLLSRDLLRAQDYERRRIARELHDSTAQLLAALSINLARLKDNALEPGRRRQALADALEQAAACSAEIRTVTYLLHPPLLEEVGLVSALQSYAQGFNQRTGIQVEIETTPDFGRVEGPIEATLFRIVQEGLANVHRHSGSPVALIRLERDGREVRLVLQDSGRGIPEDHRKSKGFVRFGVGIMGMRERAEQFGGRLELSSDATGTRLAVTIPFSHSHEEDQNLSSR